MNILMMTNTYKPILGGLERSIETFADEYRRRGHRVIIVAPFFENAVPEPDVVRMPAIQHFNGTDFSVRLPIPGFLNEILKDLRFDIIHAHHPFFMGDTAFRAAYRYNVPLVFTYHTLFEQTTHYFLGDSPAVRRFIIELTAGFANLADQVFAPSRGVASILRGYGVRSPIAVVPTGIDVEKFSKRSAVNARAAFKIPDNAFVVGYVGRLAAEKNLFFLARAVVFFLKMTPSAYFLVAGEGPLRERIQSVFAEQGLEKRVIFAGALNGGPLTDVYQAMNVFAFTSKSETQGIALIEAMAAGVPVVALKACAVDEIVEHGFNGFLVEREEEAGFAEVLKNMAGSPVEKKNAMSRLAVETAAGFSREVCAGRALALYARLLESGVGTRFSRWSKMRTLSKTVRGLKGEWELVKNFTRAAKEAVLKG